MHVYFAGINGMAGSAIARESAARSFQLSGKSCSNLDLEDQDHLFQELHDRNPEFLVIAVARVGDTTKVEKSIGWKAKTNWRELSEIMVESDLEIIIIMSR